MTRLRRSELSTPGLSEKMIARAAAVAADLVFLDLEDSVAPAAKADARSTVVDGLRELDWGRTAGPCASTPGLGVGGRRPDRGDRPRGRRAGRRDRAQGAVGRRRALGGRKAGRARAGAAPATPRSASRC